MMIKNARGILHTAAYVTPAETFTIRIVRLCRDLQFNHGMYFGTLQNLERKVNFTAQPKRGP